MFTGFIIGIQLLFVYFVIAFIWKVLTQRDTIDPPHLRRQAPPDPYEGLTLKEREARMQAAWRRKHGIEEKEDNDRG